MGITGEIGHATIHEHGLVCRCGNRGCLETVASTTAMIELLGRARPATVAPEDIVRKALARDSRPCAWSTTPGSPSAARGQRGQPRQPRGIVVIGGPLASLGDLLLDPIRRGLGIYAVPMLIETTELVMSSSANRPRRSVRRRSCCGRRACYTPPPGLKVTVR